MTYLNLLYVLNNYCASIGWHVEAYQAVVNSAFVPALFLGSVDCFGNKFLLSQWEWWAGIVSIVQSHYLSSFRLKILNFFSVMWWEWHYIGLVIKPFLAGLSWHSCVVSVLVSLIWSGTGTSGLWGLRPLFLQTLSTSRHAWNCWADPFASSFSEEKLRRHWK